MGTSHNPIPAVQGFRDLLWLPIEQYRKDGRLMRGLQRGAASFGSSTASAALELSNRLVQAIQVREGLASSRAGQGGQGRSAMAPHAIPKALLRVGSLNLPNILSGKSWRGKAKGRPWGAQWLP